MVPIKKNKESVIYAYNNGSVKRVMRLEMPLRSCLAALNGLYRQDGIHDVRITRFYRDLEPIFGKGYLFTKEDLFYERRGTNIIYIYYDSNHKCKDVKIYCLTSVVVSILSSAYYTDMIDFRQFKKLLTKYLDFDINKPSEEKRRKEKEKKKRMMEREKARKEWEGRPRILYTPMGNDNRRKTRGSK